MIQKWFQKEVLAFIHENVDKDPFEISLTLRSKQLFDDEVNRFIVEQILSRQKAKKKLPTWYNNKSVIFPPGLSVEQSSSEVTAKYKSSLFSGKSMIDLTGGMGVDTLAFATHFDKVTYLERNAELGALADHNFNQIQAKNIDVRHAEAEAYIEDNTDRYDLIYLDPARRKADAKVFQLSDCTPDIVSLRQTLLKHADSVLVKTSPFMDVHQSIQLLETVRSVYIVAVDNECKEVLYALTPGSNSNPTIITENIKKDGSQTFEFLWDDEQKETLQVASISRYLYEPNSAILKSGAFKLVSSRFGIKKLHMHTHLYTSEALINDFPGRVFEIKYVIPYNKKAFKQLKLGSKINVATRNFPDKPDQIKAKLGLKDGGDHYLFGVKDNEESLQLIITNKLR